ncbi:hypothetical protein [Sporomusa aerivorans]|uniref:hypothetical protein n=1 Tax=Sporomusa aerivorans TaxID=204936 RepID=UPI00352B27CD
MAFELTNLKYKFGNHHFWCMGNESTVDINEMSTEKGKRKSGPVINAEEGITPLQAQL